VPLGTCCYSEFRAAIASRAFLCQPALQLSLLEVTQILEALSGVELLDCRRRVFTPVEARNHQNKVLKDSTRYIREHLVEEMVDSLALGLSQWTGGLGQAYMGQQSAQFIRYAVLWVTFL
jgi:hypothetical protein